jgi:TolB-like protein/DNA-binding SARP family transcriptional activator
MESSSAHSRPPHHRLVTLGRLTLLGPDGAEDPSLGTRRRKLAVLAYLAMRDRPVTRDLLATLFWGGRDEDRARNSLSDALSHLRRVLGREAIVTRGDEVALADDAPLAVDARELREAVASEDWARAVSLYAGPFLDGVHVDDAPELEQWRSADAERLRRLFTAACAPHVQSLAQARAWESCAEVAARWLNAEPASTEAALHRLRALAAPGTTAARAAALAEYERLRARLAEEMGIGVDATVQRLAASIRAELPPVASPAPEALPVAAPAIDAQPPVARAGSSERAWPRRMRVPLTALVGVLAVIGIAAANGMRHPVDERRPVLAVLPFENVGAASDAYFADGLGDEVRARLTGISGLQVIGGASARQYRGSTKSPREIARELGATHLLTGSVRWERTPDGRGRVRVSPELVRAADQSNLWASSVEGPLDDVFAMQAQVAERVAAALDVTLLAHEQRAVAGRPTMNLAAYDAYLRGMASASRAQVFSAAARRATERELQRAVELDPTFAMAHAQLARSYLHAVFASGDRARTEDARERARAAIERAWALDSSLVLTRLVRADFLSLTGDREAADRLVRATARLAPNDAATLGAVADVEFRAGRYEAALAANRRAMMLDPRAVEAWLDLGGELDRLRRYEEAMAVREREIALVPGHEVAYAAQAADYLLWRGDTAAARRTLARAIGPLPWIVRLPGGVAGNAIWAGVLPAAVLRARDTLTLAGYLAGTGGIAPELYHLVKLRHAQQQRRAPTARAHADSLVRLIEPALGRAGDARWWYGWFSRRSVLAEAYATLGRASEAAGETDRYVAETREAERARGDVHPEQLCHALHNAAYVDALIGRAPVAVARLAEALGLPCGHRVSRALLRVDPAWAPLRGRPEFERLVATGPH